MEHELVSATLTPKQEKELHRDIENLKTQVGSAASAETLEVEMTKLEERLEEIDRKIDILYEEKKVYNDKYPAIKTKRDEKKELVDKLKQDMLKFKEDRKNMKTEQDNDREAFYDRKTKRKQAVEAEIKRYSDSIDALWDEYNKSYDEYMKQQDWIRYIKWQQGQKERLVRKKEWEERDKARKEREKEDQAKEQVRTRKYDIEIKCCEYLVDYCDRLKPAEQKQEEVEKTLLSAEDLKAKMKEDGAWKKEKDLVVIASKKTQDLDIEVGNNKKNKKKQKQAEQATSKKGPTVFSHEIQIRNAFDTVKVLPPQTAEELEKTLKEIQERREYYLKAGAEELAQEIALREQKAKEAAEQSAVPA